MVQVIATFALYLITASDAFHVVSQCQLPGCRFLSDDAFSEAEDVGRRRILFGAALLANIPTVSNAAASSLLVDVPMIRLKLPKNGLGQDYVAMELCVKGRTAEFMIDSGLTLEMVTPHLKEQLNLQSEQSLRKGLAAGGATGQLNIVDLRETFVCENGKELLALPDMHAIVTDFPQEHIDPKHDPVEGMLGQEVLSRYDVDLDFVKKRVRLYEPGTADKKSTVEIPASVINESGLIAIRLTTGGVGQQPVPAILDCGSTFSVLNWKAASILGLPPKEDAAYASGPSIEALGIDGRPVRLPTIQRPLSFAGEFIRKQGRLVGFQSPPTSWKPWKPVTLAVGDLPVFEDVLGDGKTPYNGPAALLGLDVLAQRRIIFESAGDGSRNRRRRVFVQSS